MACPAVARRCVPSRRDARETPESCCDVLQRRRAKVIDLKRHLAGGVLTHAGGDADATGLGQRLQACYDDHTVAQQIVALRHHLALMHAYA
jgi:hypothetical protein